MVNITMNFTTTIWENVVLNFFPSIEKANPSISVRETNLNQLVSVVTCFQWDAGGNEPGSILQEGEGVFLFWFAM